MTAPVDQTAFAVIPGITMEETPRPAVVLPHQMPETIDWFPEAKVLSLDCFDTLIWRDSHAPVDVFATLPGITPMQRRWAEAMARKVAGHAHNRNEVSIAEIYAQLMPNAAPAERDAAIAAELNAEARACFAFAPTVDLIRRAKARGMQVVIVSDSYLDAGQLRTLIEQAAGADVAALIDKVFASSAFGRPKALGLYQDVLRKLSARPHEILHIGDNKGADVDGVAPFGVSTLHLKQFPEELEQQLRLESGASAMIHPNDTRLNAAQPHRAPLAMALPVQESEAARLGLSTLGPVLTGYDMWLRAQAEELAEQHGGKVHWLFLMRDGWLPMQIHNARTPLATAHAIEMSRFTATAASFATERDVARFMEQELGMEPAALARQVLMPTADIDKLCEGRKPEDAGLALWHEMRKEPRKRATVAASRAMAKRLIAHIRARVNPAPGDTLMLVDLGYNGSVQNRIDAVLAKGLGVHVAGRYLLLREMNAPGLDKKGFIGTDHYDFHTLEALCANVAVLEQLCTTGMGSVIDYTEDGDPIHRANDITQQQATVREAVQQGALEFARAKDKAIIRGDEGHPTLPQWREAATASLTRLMYLPLAHELAVIARFEHDVNLGTNDKLALFDPAIAETGMRQRGLFYLKGSERMYLPAEMHGHGLAPKLALLSSKRFGLPLNFVDFADKAVDVPVIFADQSSGDLFEQVVAASATHDGYHMAAVPLGDCRYGAAIRFGASFGWVELDSIHALPVKDFLSDDPFAIERQIPMSGVLEGIEAVTPRLLRCDDPAGFLMVNPPERMDDTPMMLAVVFRPLASK